MYYFFNSETLLSNLPKSDASPTFYRQQEGVEQQSMLTWNRRLSSNLTDILSPPLSS